MMKANIFFSNDSKMKIAIHTGTCLQLFETPTLFKLCHYLNDNNNNFFVYTSLAILNIP